MSSPEYKEAKSLGLIEKDRWSEGIPHHPESLKLFEFLKEHDSKDYAGYSNWKKGGDGDNGEILLYQLDAFFEVLDTKKEK